MTVGKGLLAFLIAVLVIAARPAAAEEVRLKHGGLTLNARLVVASEKTLADGVIVIVHGTLAHSGSGTIAGLASTLGERGLSTLAINLSLGIDDRQGMYDCGATHRHRHLDALDEIGAWLDWLRAKGAGPVLLLGHSRGGNQVARFAAERGHPVLRRLVLLAPMTSVPERTAARFKQRNGASLLPVMQRAAALVATGKGATVMKGVGVLYCPGADVTAASFASYYPQSDLRLDTPSIVEEIKLPTLVVAGSDDRLVPDVARRIKPMADGKPLSLAVVEGADHFFLDLFAEDVADHIEELLGRAK